MLTENNYIRELGELFEEAFDLDSTPISDALNKESERYINFEHYSEGGLKTIFRCYDTRTDRFVAMAMPKQYYDSQKVESFLREAKLNSSLQHPNIVPVYDIGMNENSPWFTMKFISGKSLNEIILELKNEEQSKFSELNERLDVFLKICEAIAYSHSIGIVHLDLKPDNIRISNYGDVVVCDWGLADVDSKICDESLLDYCSLVEYDLTVMTVDGVIKGTAGYMAPEQTGFTKIRKGPHTDIFSLGAILYTLLCYEKAFRGESFKEIVKNTAAGNFQPPSEIKPDIPYSLEAVCLKAMSHDKEDRYQSVEEIISEIQAYRNGFTTGAENASILKAFKLFYLRHKILCLISFIALILLISVTILSFNQLSLTRKNAIQLAEKMSLEAEYHRTINKEAAPLFLERAKIAYQAFLFEDVKKFTSTTVELDASMTEAWNLKAVAHFATEEYKAASLIFEKMGNNSLLALLNEKYLALKPDDNKPLPMDQYLELAQQLIKAKNFKIFGNIIHHKCYSELTIDDRIKFIKDTVAMSHSKQLVNNKFNFEFDKKTAFLDVSNNRWLKNVASLQNFPARSANFSNTSIPNCVAFRGQKLTSLNLCNTRVMNLQSLNTENLKYLNLSGTEVMNLQPLYGSSLEVLVITNTNISSLNFTRNLKKLRELHIHEGQFSIDELNRLPKSIKVISVSAS